MKSYALALSATLVAGAALACDDQVQKPAPTEPKAAAAKAIAPASAPVTSGSTVCLSYVTKRAAAKAQLKHAKELQAEQSNESAAGRRAAKAEAQLEKLEAIVADACS